MAEFVPEDQAVPYLEAVLAAYQKFADKGERLHTVVARTGMPGFKAKIAENIASK